MVNSTPLLQIIVAPTSDDLHLLEFSGSEALSEIFDFKLRISSTSLTLHAHDFLSKPLAVRIAVDQHTVRYFHGYIFNFQAGQSTAGYRYYHFTLKPWLWFLNYTTDCRLFQNKSVLEIIQQIFTEYKFHTYDISNLKNSYPKLELCVQYRETALNFVTRLLEEAGIFYFFRHSAQQHTLLLADNIAGFTTCLTAPAVLATGSYKSRCLTRWQRQQTFYSGKFTQKDFNFETPELDLTSLQTTRAKFAPAQAYELFHYPGRHQVAATGTALAQQHFAAQEAQHEIINGESNYLEFQSGSKFTFIGTSNINTSNYYWLISVVHYASNSGNSTNTQFEQSYHNLFTCIPAGMNYKPPLLTPKPTISNAQTAIVVGPPGEELHTDKYGRVRVQFHWDRQGKKNDQSSGWVRVMQMWAGNHWGTLFMPRIGQEVVVQFLDGDPDRPLIVGSVYNEANLPPYTLPLEQTYSGIKTHSTPNGSTDSANELRFNDQQDAEEILIRAQKDFKQVIKNDLTIEANNQCVIQAQQAIELRVGGHTLQINTQGIFVDGEKLK